MKAIRTNAMFAISTALMLLVLQNSQVAESLPTCGSEVVDTGADQLVFAVVGGELIL